MAHIREAFFRATAAIQRMPNAREAQEATKALADLMRDLQKETAAFRAYEAACLMDAHGLTRDELAAFLGVSGPRVSQIISAARKRGNPVTEPLTLPEQPHVALAIITSDQGVLVAKRRDGIPPYTFLGGEFLPGETGEQALRRKVEAEAGLTVDLRALHRQATAPEDLARHDLRPCRGRAGRAAPGRPRRPGRGPVGQHRRDAGRLCRDMYGPVRQYLDELQRVG